ncbi:hypothetical protein FKM82_025511 [Ascaphus truei]
MADTQLQHVHYTMSRFANFQFFPFLQLFYFVTLFNRRYTNLHLHYHYHVHNISGFLYVHDPLKKIYTIISFTFNIHTLFNTFLHKLYTFIPSFTQHQHTHYIHTFTLIHASTTYITITISLCAPHGNLSMRSADITSLPGAHSPQPGM